VDKILRWMLTCTSREVIGINITDAGDRKFELLYISSHTRHKFRLTLLSRKIVVVHSLEITSAQRIGILKLHYAAWLISQRSASSASSHILIMSSSKQFLDIKSQEVLTYFIPWVQFNEMASENSKRGWDWGCAGTIGRGWRWVGGCDGA
jgi:hypothetical protein